MPATPYDPAKTRQLLSVAGGHASNPAAEYIEALAEQLRAAEDEIGAAAATRQKSETDANRYAAELATAQRTIREMRDGNVGTEPMRKTLESIALNPKGAKRLAADTLAKLNGNTLTKVT